MKKRKPPQENNMSSETFAKLNLAITTIISIPTIIYSLMNQNNMIKLSIALIIYGLLVGISQIALYAYYRKH